MGLDREAVQFLIACSADGVRFDRTATIGRQFLFLHPKDLSRAFRNFGGFLSSEAAGRIRMEAGGYAEPLLRELGATAVESLDASTYEGGSICHDMNQPLPGELQKRFSTVL